MTNWIERGEQVRARTPALPDGAENRAERRDIVAHTIIAWSGFDVPGYSYTSEIVRLSKEIVDLIEKMRANPAQHRNFMPAPKKAREADVLPFRGKDAAE